MNSRLRYIFIASVLFIACVDGISFVGLLYDFPALRTLPFILVYWIIPVLIAGSLYLFGRRLLRGDGIRSMSGFFEFTGIFLALYVPKLLYDLLVGIEYIVKAIVYPVWHFISPGESFAEFFPAGPLNFISRLALPLAALAFLVILWGMFRGRFNYRLRLLEVRSPDLPDEFDGFRIVQISDLHLGSLGGKQERIRQVVERINAVSPDLVLFTGDLVNNIAEEAEDWTGLLSEMVAGSGKFSILGNHDYGEYYHWTSEESRQENMNRLYRAHRDSGFTLLRNQSVKIKRGRSEIFIAGVENWGLPPFRQYGDLDKALEDIPGDAYTILLSHDPSHWDAEVLGKTNVRLTLSGHTHGMQFGIRTRWFRWSPIQWKYPRWIGLYAEGGQYLYVNPGLGYIGYAGRIGVPPEITLITLKRSE